MKLGLLMTKRVVITGASKEDGVGFQLARELLNRGHQVIITARDLSSPAIQNVSDEANSNLIVKQLDLCDPSSIELFIDDILKTYGYIDVLVNNAANVAYGPVETLSQSDLQTTFQTKVFGPIALIQGFIPSMRQRKSGLFITTSSIFATMPVTLQAFSSYISAICAFETIQQCLAIELKPWNIDVVNFQPGPISTTLSKFEGSKKEMFENEYKDFVETAYAWVKENIPFQTAKEVAPVYRRYH